MSTFLKFTTMKVTINERSSSEIGAVKLVVKMFYNQEFLSAFLEKLNLDIRSRIVSISITQEFKLESGIRADVGIIVNDLYLVTIEAKNWSINEDQILKYSDDKRFLGVFNFGLVINADTTTKNAFSLHELLILYKTCKDYDQDLVVAINYLTSPPSEVEDLSIDYKTGLEVLMDELLLLTKTRVNCCKLFNEIRTNLYLSGFVGDMNVLLREYSAEKVYELVPQFLLTEKDIDFLVEDMFYSIDLGELKSLILDNKSNEKNLQKVLLCMIYWLSRIVYLDRVADYSKSGKGPVKLVDDKNYNFGTHFTLKRDSLGLLFRFSLLSFASLKSKLGISTITVQGKTYDYFQVCDYFDLETRSISFYSVPGAESSVKRAIIEVN